MSNKISKNLITVLALLTLIFILTMSVRTCTANQKPIVMKKIIKKYTNNDFKKASQELLENYNAIYNAETTCSELASILSRSKSKWAEYSIKDLCLNPKNFDNIETTSIKGLGKHLIPFSEILKLINICENNIPYNSRIKIYTYMENVIIKIVHHFTISWDNPYQEVINKDFSSIKLKRIFNENFLDKLSNLLEKINFPLYCGAIISY